MKSSPQVVRVELTGGLANQLFQWASGELARRTVNARLELDGRIVDRPDGRGEQVSRLVPSAHVVGPSEREAAFWRNVHRHLPGPARGALKRTRRATFRLERPKPVSTYEQAVSALSDGDSVRMVGLFQNAELLWGNKDLIQRDVAEGLRRHPTPVDRYSAVHVRRGDYVTVEKYRRMFGVCTPDYYRSAVRLLPQSLPVHVVSDDPDWAYSALTEGDTRVTHAITVHRGNDHFQDLALLAGAENLVLSNSTFSWWGAYVSSAGTVISPEPWFSDSRRDRGLVGRNWVRLDRG